MRQRCVHDCDCYEATAKVPVRQQPLWLLPPLRPAACAPSRKGVSPLLWQNVLRCGQRGLPCCRGSRSSPPFSPRCCKPSPGRRFPPPPGPFLPLPLHPGRRLSLASALCRQAGSEQACWQCVSLPPWHRRFTHNPAPSGMGASASMPRLGCRQTRLWARWPTMRHDFAGSRHFRRRCYGPSRPSDAVPYFSRCRICSILTVMDGSASQCYSPPRDRRLLRRFGLGMHEGR
jgi:hypothetical protein